MAYASDKVPLDLTAKTTPVDADVVIIGDSADASEVAKKTTWANIKATLKTYFDTLYATAGSGITDGDKGDITVSGSGTTWTIDTGSVTNGKMFGMDQALIKGRASGAGTGPVTDLTATQVRTILNVAEGTIARSISSIATPTTAGATASTDYVYNVTNTTLTLPTAVSNTNQYTIKCISGTCVVDGDGAETIDGSANITIQVEDSVDLISNNTEWKVV